MQYLFILMVACTVLTAKANPTYDKLSEVNKCWKQQTDLSSLHYPEYSTRTDREWIKVHLSLVEQVLRSRSYPQLTTEQKKNRLNALDHLHEYWQAGNFPVNEDFTYSLPIFIDKYDNFCAVGYLVKATGYEAVSRKISAQTNYAYVREMKYPELGDWAKKYGFTIDELAWIQPVYGPHCTTLPIGRGTDGNVNELYVDTSTQRLFVGGEFNRVDSTITANNIAYVTESAGVYTWHNMGTGVHGTVNAVTKFGSNIFVAGVIDSAGGLPVNNVAYWNGSSWAAAGCINGIVRDLIVYKGSLYACGTFSVCSSPTIPGNFAVWTGTSWQQITSLTGYLNTMEVVDSMLFIGGGFNYNGNPKNVIKWNPYTGFQTFSNRVKNEVMDFEIFYDTVYAVCKQTAGNDTVLRTRLISNTWDSTGSWHNYSAYGTLSVNTLCAVGDTFMVGGDFYYVPNVMGTYISGNFCITPYYLYLGLAYIDGFTVDSSINKMVAFKNKLIFGGTFKYGNQLLNGIGIMKTNVPAPAPFSISAGVMKIACKTNNDGTAAVGANLFTGKPPYTFLWSTGDTAKTIYNLAPGTYTVIGTDSKGAKDTATVVITATTFDTSLNVSGKTLFAKMANVKYKWVDCGNNYNHNEADTNFMFSPSKTGNYALIMTRDGCSDTTSCYTVTLGSGTRVSKINDKDLAIFPNPVEDVVHIRFNELVNNTEISITDIMGRKVKSVVIINAKETTIDTRSWSTGVYMISVKEETGIISYHKLIKN